MTTPPETSAALLDEILTEAAAAASALASTTPAERASWLEVIADALDGAADQLVPVAMAETKLGSDRLYGELRRTTFQLRLFAGTIREGSYLKATIDHADPDWPMGPRPDIRRTMRPLGPTLVFAASNFPFAFSVAGGDTAAALAAGAPVIVKASPGHPELSVRVAELVRAALERVGAPAGALGLISGVETGRLGVLDARVKAVCFTGSLEGGRALHDLAVSRPDPIPFYGELGSLNPAFVTEAAASARADAIADGFVKSVTLGAGQFCTKPGFLLVPTGSNIQGRIIETALNYEGAPMLNTRIRDGFVGAVDRVAAHGGTKVLVDGRGSHEDPRLTVFVTDVPTLTADAGALLVECFGPAAVLVEYGDDEELLAAARTFSGQLTATVHAQGQEQVVPDLLELLHERVGRVVWNSWPTGVSVTHAMQHGGPYPATTAPLFTSVGTASIDRFLRPVSYQDVPAEHLPAPVRDDNPWAVPQRVDGTYRAYSEGDDS